jgi:hypothetical protein
MTSVAELKRGEYAQLAFSSITERIGESRKTFFSSLLKENVPQERKVCGASHVLGRRFARAEEAPSRDALRGILRGDAKRALDCALPAPGDGHTHSGSAEHIEMA